MAQTDRLVYIESNFSGSCYKPDIDVDGSGYAHITYTDTKAETCPYLWWWY